MNDKPACLLRVTFLFDDICVQANKMGNVAAIPYMSLRDAAEKGDLEASVPTIRATRQL